MTALTSPAPTSEPAHAPREPLFLGRLSDEELVLLDAEHPAVQLPYLQGLGEVERTLAVQAGMRGMQARGFTVDAQQRRVRLPQQLSDALDVRAGARHALVVQIELRVPGQEPVAVELYAFVLDGFVLLEELDEAGMHDFFALELADLPAELQRRVAACPAGDGSGEPVALDLAAVAAGTEPVLTARVGTELGHVDAAVWRADGHCEQLLQTVLLGTAGCHLVREPHGTAGPVRLVPLAHAQVGAAVAGLLEASTMPR